VLPTLRLGELTQAVFDIDDAAEAFRVHVSGEVPKVILRCSEFADHADGED
jgi:(R,R)-butanediol dehydrogenase/meso-butanediol dehydrogenase/diacetyl reductase/L-iditol 2-dehydrogenase